MAFLYIWGTQGVKSELMCLHCTEKKKKKATGEGQAKQSKHFNR